MSLRTCQPRKLLDNCQAGPNSGRNPNNSAANRRAGVGAARDGGFSGNTTSSDTASNDTASGNTACDVYTV